MSYWRKRVGKTVFKDTLELTLSLSVGLGLARRRDFEEVVVDTTVQEKTIAHPTDARLYDTARRKLVAMAQSRGLRLRQTYARVGPADLRQHGRYCHAKQFKRARKVRKRLRNVSVPRATGSTYGSPPAPRDRLSPRPGGRLPDAGVRAVVRERGRIGDELNALGAGFGFNLRKVLKGLAALAVSVPRTHPTYPTAARSRPHTSGSNRATSLGDAAGSRVITSVR